MKRDRAWRRYMKKKHTLKRLRVYIYRENYFMPFRDVNDDKIYKIRINDYIGLYQYFMSKSYSTDKWTTKYKVKYSPNKTKGYWRYKNDINTREHNKRELLKILKEYGIK